MSTKNATQQQDRNPWKGLNFYIEGETLYGRDNEIQSLAQYIINNTQTVLYGKSGIGKSSIVNAGIFPIARKEGLYPIPIRLKHDKDSSYISQIKSVFQESGIGMNEVVPVIDASKETLWEFIHRHSFFHPDTGLAVRPLVVFDQFEEIFTLQHDEGIKKGFFSELADLLNEVTPQYIIDANDQKPSAPAATGSSASAGFTLDFGTDSTDDTTEYIESSLFSLVFSIREDFLSYLERYTAYIPVMKTNRYALLPINEEQAAEIIMKPREGLVSRSVAELIIQKVTGIGDFVLDGIPEIEVDAAVLSLYLSRLYIKKGDAPTISAELVNQFSDDIIKDFYVESVSDLPSGDIEEIEDQLLTYDGRRNNVSRYDLISEGVSEEVIQTLVEDRKLLRQFSYQSDIRVEFMHDILCPIVDARINQREELRKQEEERKRQEAEKAKLDEEHQKLILQQKRDRRRFRRTLFWSAAFILLLVGGYLFSAYWTQWEYEEYYSSFTRQNGWPVGVNRLHKKDIKNLSIYYRLSREGRNPSRPFTQVDVCSSTDVVIPSFRSPLVGTTEKTDIKANEFSSLNMNVRIIRFAAESDADNASVSRELYYDGQENLLYAINYFRTVDISSLQTSQNSTSLWAVYVDKDGLPLKVRDNGADRMKVFLSSDKDKNKDKLEIKYMFYDEKGSPQSNDIGSYGFRIVYNDNLTIDSLFHLDPFSMENLAEVREYDENENSTTYYTIGSDKEQKIHELLGYAKRIDRLDEHANIVERYFYGKNEQLIDSAHCAIERRHYDNYYRPDSIFYYDAKDNLTGYTVYKYIGTNSYCSEEHRYAIEDRQVQLTYEEIHKTSGEVTDNIINDSINHIYRHEQIVNKVKDHEIVYSYFDKENNLVFDSLAKCSRFTEITRSHGDGTIRIVHKYDANGNLFSSNQGRKAVAIDSAYYDRNGNRRVHVTFNANGEVLTSMGYDYKDGVEITRYALSLDGITPIRCPQWEIDSLCYYKLNNVKNAQQGFNLAYIKAVSEYPSCASYIYFPSVVDTLSYDFDPITTTIGERWQRQERVSINIPPVPAKAHTVQYVHITNLKGSAYTAGIQDGDLLLEKKNIGKTELLLTVMRYKGKRWQKYHYRITTANMGMEFYPVAYTDDEFAFYETGRRNCQ